MGEPKPQLSVRSARAYELARRISEKEGRSYPEIIEEALELYVETKRREAARTVEAFWAPIEASMAKGRAKLRPGVTSEHSDLYDDYGLPA